MKIEEIKQIEDEHYKEVSKLYEEFANKNIGKFYKQKHRNEHRYFGDHDYTILLYIHTIQGRNISAIEFNDINIQRSGFDVKWFVKDKWEEITEEEFKKELKYYEKLFHFEEIFEK